MQRFLGFLSDILSTMGFGLLIALCLMTLFVTTNPAIKGIIDEEGAAEVSTRPPVTLIITCKTRESGYPRCRPDSGGNDAR